MCDSQIAGAAASGSACDGSSDEITGKSNSGEIVKILWGVLAPRSDPWMTPEVFFSQEKHSEIQLGLSFLRETIFLWFKRINSLFCQ